MILSTGFTAAISWETIGDLGCTAMTGFLGSTCLPILYDDIIDSDADIVQDDVYLNALQVNDSRDQLMTEQRSHLNQTYGMGMSRAKLTAIEALNNGTSQSEAKQMALNDLKDFYSVQQKRLINYQNREVIKWNSTIRNSVEDTSGLSYNDVIQSPWCSNAQTSPGIELVEGNYTLLNDTSAQEIRMYIHDENLADFSASGCHMDDSENYNQKRFYVAGMNPQFDPQYLNKENLVVQSSSGNTTQYMSINEFEQTETQIRENFNRSKQNMLPMIENVYSNYNEGELNASEVLGPLEALQLASTNYEDTGFYSYRALSLEQMGLESNQSYAFDVTWTNPGAETKTSVGQLFVAEDAYNDTIETGKEYNASDVTAFLIHTPEGEEKADRTPLKGTFTVNEMINKDTGEEVSSTGIQSTEFYTTGTQDLQRQIQEVLENQEQLEAPDNSGVIGGTTSWINKLLENTGIPQINQGLATTAGIILLAVFILLLIGTGSML
ncbi:hypothetical protein [Candidatus Nanohalococcus occultus]|uniref:hypothetical protein n=1 Tax=Candidatus Nanohalococcus occultus TaxID=2978047 RepID=UPI0039E16587